MALTSVADGLFAEKHGTGPATVVALHGWGRRGADFDRVLNGLDALAIELPGFGASPPPPEPTGARGYAKALRPVVEALPGPAVLVGHSFGGRVALTLASFLDVAGLVLTGVPVLRSRPPARPSTAYRMARWAHGRGLIGDRRMEAIRRRRGSEDYRAASGVMRGVLVATVAETYEPELASVDAPVELVWGADDREVPVTVAERAHAALAGRGVDATLTVLAGVGHHVPIEAPEALRAAIDRILAP